MKPSIQLLLALVLLIIGGLFVTKYQLKQDYAAIDRTDPFYAFETTSDLNFSHINVSGGNYSQLIIEPGDNNLYIEKSHGEGIEYHLASDTLYILFDENHTIESNSRESRWANRSSALVIIQSDHLSSLVANNASIEIDLSNTSNFESSITGYSKLAILNEDESLKALHIESHDQSSIRINKEGNILALKELGLQLNDESIAEIYQTISDSAIFQLDSNSRISGDALFFKQNSY
jgi:hypothetical protein